MVKLTIFIESRGSYRKEICYFPPMKLKLKNATLDDPCLDRVNKLKQVTHSNTPAEYEQYLFTKNLVYKHYKLLT